MIYHITTRAEIDAAARAGEYRPRAFAREGFVHCSYAGQVIATANRLFRGQPGLVLVEIDPRALAVPVVDENLVGGAECFPHVYGPVPMSAVIAVHPLPRGDDGLFSWPPGARRGEESDPTRSG